MSPEVREVKLNWHANIQRVVAGLAVACSVALGVALGSGQFLDGGVRSGNDAGSWDVVDEASVPVASVSSEGELAYGSSRQTEPAYKAARDAGTPSPEVVAADDGRSLSSALPYEPAQVLVQLADGVVPDEALAELARQGFADAGADEAESAALGWTVLHLADGADVPQAVRALQQSGLAEQAQPNYVYHLLEAGLPSVSASSSNPSTQAQAAGGEGGAGLVASGVQAYETAISDDALIAYNEWWMKAIGVKRAWELQPTAKTVTVAVVDTGCNVAHPDLKGNIDASRGYNALTGKTGAAAVKDTDGHGTHVAGIISAIPNNGIGVAGVAADARIVPIKVIDSETSSTSFLLKAYNYIMKLGARDPSVRIVNMSLGGSGGYDPALLRAIDKAYSEYGILSVFAAGNDDEKPPYYCFPCDYAEVGLGVINVSQSVAERLVGKQDSTSNYNVRAEKTKDLCAPGGNILSTYLTTGSAQSSARGFAGYAYSSGTSMSTPIVSAAAALVIAANPSLSAAKVKSILCSTAADIKRADGSGLGFDAYTGYGLVQVDKAVAAARSGYLNGKDALAVGGSITLAAPTKGNWKWVSGSKKIATVDQDGKVVGRSSGEVVISAANASTGQRLYKTVVVYDAGIKGVASVRIGKLTIMQLQASPITLASWKSSNTKVASVNATTGVVSAKKAGAVTITATLTAAPNVKVKKKLKVVKQLNPMTVKVRTELVSKSKLRRSACAVAGAITFSKKPKGAVTYTKVSGSSYLSIAKKTGKITVKRRTPSGTYAIKVKVRAAGNATYLAKTRIVTVKVRVR